MQTEYVIEMYDLYTPLKHSITQDVVDKFEYLLGSSSNFATWYGMNESKLRNLDHVNLSEYVHPAILGETKIYSKIQLPQHTRKINDIFTVPNDLSLRTGGKMGKTQKFPEESQETIIYSPYSEKKDLLLLSIVYYLYSSTNINKDVLPIPKSKMNNLVGGVLIPDTVEDISGYKKQERLVFMFGILYTNDKFCIKIVPSYQDEYLKEVLIYEQLNKDNANMNDRIIKIFGHGTINKLDSEPSQIDFDILDDTLVVKDTSMLGPIFQFMSDVNDIRYFITEKNDSFCPLDDFVTRNIIYYNQYFCTFIIDLFTLLRYLNLKYGFVHWDLHFGNLLVSSNLQFKLYDFDMSMTTEIPNEEIFRRLPYLKHVYDAEANKKKFGFYYDMINFLVRLDENALASIYRGRCPHTANSIASHIIFDIIDFIKVKNDIVSASNDYYDNLVYMTSRFINRSTNPVKTIVGGKQIDYYKKYLKYKTKYTSMKTHPLLN